MELSITKLFIGADRPWLVMLHGFGGSRATWKKQEAAFGEKYNMFIIELPGHGASCDGIAGDTSADMSAVSDMIIDTLRAEGIDSAHFLALSLGTLVLTCILQKAPEMVSSVVLCGAVFGIGFFSKIALYLGNTLKYIFPYMTVAALMAAIMMPKKSHKVSRQFLVKECKKLGRAEFMRWYTISVRELDRLVKHASLLRKIPSLVIMGSEDLVFLDRARRTVKKIGGGVVLRIIENCGHVCNIQRAKEFNLIAAEFFARCERGTQQTV